MKVEYLTNATELAKHIIKSVLNPGDIAIDATMGNGNDTLFLSQLVGPKGKVISFDIQDIALENTSQLLRRHNIITNVKLIKDGHQNVDKYITDEISGIMFNLGYLPKGEHSIVTKPETTKDAIAKCLNILKKKGIITIAIYYGHCGGEIEKDVLLSYLEQLDQTKFNVLKMDFINQKNKPPLLIAIEKK